MSRCGRLLSVLATLFLLPPPGFAAEPQARTIAFTYRVTVQPDDTAAGPMDIFLPIARDTPQQQVLQVRVEAPVAGDFGNEEIYGNRFWHARLAEPPDTPLTIQVDYRVRRYRFGRDDLQQASADYGPDVQRDYARFLQANQRVPVEGELIRDVLADIPLAPSDTPVAEARKIYDYVIDTMEYKKVGSGWGNGDTYWACSKEYGNCTDYHALFTSLARARDIPARFEIGFPVPLDQKAGRISGYHCWLELYLPEVGWTPIDASEADKHPAMRETYFGPHPANRIHFTTGRDLTLSPAQSTGPLNYFVYPLVEVGEARYSGVATEFRYRVLGTATAAKTPGHRAP
ncbi:transglutaminase-like domain-containing protein [Thiohalorhabdus sp.]|uniref:transglutaminase-like domain-containing protein n=1 Tax=Thiohalorhabdus sp. TaxID=3094134 RepID=UPI002FC3A2D9